MEKKIHFLSKKILWVFLLVQIVMLSSALELTTAAAPEFKVSPKLESENIIPTDDEGYAWSAWGSWSACSKTCGGGVSVQKRRCLPRTTIASMDNSSIPAPVITVRVTRHTHEHNCVGLDKRYHECNNIPCPGGLRNSRAAQCAAFDRRPFRGRFYTWLPYIDGNSPCTLNCRPLGQHFYASLSLVADGTPCTRQGSRAICIQGACKFALLMLLCQLELQKLAFSPWVLAFMALKRSPVVSIKNLIFQLLIRSCIFFDLAYFLAYFKSLPHT